MNEETKPQENVVDDVLLPPDVVFTTNLTTIIDKPIIKITKSFDGKILSILIGDDKENVTEQKDLGSVNSMKDYIDRNANENTTFLLQHDHAQWVNLGKDGFLK